MQLFESKQDSVTFISHGIFPWCELWINTEPQEFQKAAYFKISYQHEICLYGTALFLFVLYNLSEVTSCVIGFKIITCKLEECKRFEFHTLFCLANRKVQMNHTHPPEPHSQESCRSWRGSRDTMTSPTWEHVLVPPSQVTLHWQPHPW